MTEKDILLVVVCMAVSLFVSPREPVKAEMKLSAMAETVADAVPYIIGRLRSI